MVQNNQTAFSENVERTKLLVDALRVYDEFIREGAALNVNISHESKAKFDVIFQAALEQGALQSHDVLNSEQLKEFSVGELQTLYEGAFKEIMRLLVEDLLRKFKNTPEYDAISLELLQNSFRTSSQGPNLSIDTQPIPIVISAISEKIPLGQQSRNPPHRASFSFPTRQKLMSSPQHQ
jgi:hypothetical protein